MNVTPPNFSAPGPPDDQRFERNKFRQTMPNNPRYTQTPRTNPAVSRLHNQNQNCPSPSSSCVSTDTTYTQPWKSNKANYEQPSSSKFRRSASVSMKKSEEEEEHDLTLSTDKSTNGRPIINFVQLKKSLMKPFKGNSKKAKINERKEDLPSTSRPMQQEERLKMFRKVGMKQSLKVSAVQRMQKERQRDFQLVGGNPQNETKRKSDESTYAQIDSMLVFSSPSKKSREIISLNDDDVEVVIKNKKTGKSATRQEIACPSKKINEIPLTSTPKSFSNVGMQENDLNISTVSNSSLCVVEENNSEKNRSIYYSTTALESDAFQQNDDRISRVDSVTPTQTQYSTIVKPTPQKTIKTEIVEPAYDKIQNPSSHSQCPSVSGESPDLSCFPIYSGQLQFMSTPPLLNQPIDDPSEDTMKEFWRISRDLKQKHELLQYRQSCHSNISQRLRGLTQVKMCLLEGGKNDPTNEMLVSLWKNCQEEEILREQIVECQNIIYQTTAEIQTIEHRKNMLLECDANFGSKKC
ncbi:unnamed protein product [Caenorhabditis angaria]|uniref:Uncharacterized protein n=1 Tax=Caenorhabditis angaria TaxID=860376 RepID=A0A9P1N316_9PELO|nr:unnamed protein product [Caenorhabditis angaria]